MITLFENLTTFLSDNWQPIFFFTALSSVIIQLFYYLFFYLRISLKSHSKDTPQPPKPPVSVVICAKNEEENLRNNLPAFLNQDYPEYEVFVALDACTDNSVDLLKNLSANYPRLRYTVIPLDPKFRHGKKVALTIAIKGAKYEHLLLTDADCIPASTKWIEKMTAPFLQSYSLVLGYGKYKEERSFLNKLTRYETFFIAQQYLSMAKAGVPYMGVGRNLAYTKSVYYAEKGFSKHAHIESGDDDLFVNAVANKTNCYAEYSAEAHTLSEAPRSFSWWQWQKKRHFKSSALYKSKHKLLLFLEPFSRELSWVLPVILLFSEEWMIPSLILLLARFLVFMTITKVNLKKLNETKLLGWAPVFDIMLPFLHLVFLAQSKFSRKVSSWK